jgi:hypothetical protein
MQGFIRHYGYRQAIEEYVVKLRGDLKRTMVAIRNMNGIIDEKSISDFIEKLQFNDITY